MVPGLQQLIRSLWLGVAQQVASRSEETGSRVKTLRWLLVNALVGLLGGTAVSAQDAPTSPVVKQWPASGARRVLLVKMQPSPGAGLACLLVTRDRAATPSNPMSWALRYSRHELLIIENSMGAGDATILGFALAINGKALGTYAIAERLQPEHGPSVVSYVSAIAPVTDPVARERIVAALRTGGTIRIERRGQAIEEVLDESVASSFEACRRELVR